MPKSFNFNTTLKVLARFGVTAKSQPAIIKTLKIGITETKKELSVVCFAIVLTAIQDRKSFKKIKQNMKREYRSSRAVEPDRFFALQLIEPSLSVAQML